MKLNADVLYDNLCRHVNLECHGKKRKDILFGRPEFITCQSCKLKSNHLYIALADKLSRHPLLEPDVLIVCLGGNPPMAYLNDNTICFVVKSNTDLLTVSNILTAIFNKYDEWDEKMEEVIECSGDLTKFVKIGTDIFNEPIMILDSQFRYLAYSDMIDKREDLADYRSDKYGNVILDKLSDFLKSYSTNVSVREPICTTLLHDMVSINLFHGEETIGSVTVIFANQLRTSGDIAVAEYFARKTEKLINKYSVSLYTQKDILKDIVLSLLHCYPVDEKEWKKVGEGKIKGSFVCVKIVMKNPSRKVPLEYITNGIEQNLPGTIVVVYENSIVAVVNTDQFADGAETLEKYIQKLLKNVDVVIGISVPFTELVFIRTFYRQASIAMELGMEKNPEDNKYSFEEYTLSYMLSHCNGEFTDELLYRKGMNQLIKRDMMSNSEYIRTLRVYLDNNMNVTRTANTLNIHKTTFLARLKRINEILDADLSDPDVRLQLSINLRKINS